MRKPVRLTQVDRFHLRVKDPFDFRYTLWKPSHFPTPLECHNADTSWRTFRIDKHSCVVRMRRPGRVLVCDVFADKQWDKWASRELRQRIVWSYGLQEDIREFARCARTVPVLKRAWKRMAGMRASCPEGLFEIAVISLVLQNTTVQRSAQMINALLDLYGRVVVCDGFPLSVFFGPEDLRNAKETELREKCRLGYRAKFLNRYADFFCSRGERELMACPMQELMEELRSINGVGPYTANVIASHALRDTSAIAIDVWNRRILSAELLGHEDADADDIRQVLRSICPKYEGLAAMYLVEYRYIDCPVSPLIDTRPL